MNQDKEEIAWQVLGLAATLNDGLEHICQRHDEGHNPMDTVGLFANIVHVLAEIETVLQIPPRRINDVQNALGHPRNIQTR